VALSPETELVVVFSSGNWVEADMVVCALEGYEIPALVIDDNVCRINPQAALLVGGVKVIVRSDDVEGAAEVLQAAYGAGPPFTGGFFSVPLSWPAALIAWLRAPSQASTSGAHTP